MEIEKFGARSDLVSGPMIFFLSVFMFIFWPWEELPDVIGYSLVGLMIYGVILMLVVSILNWRKSIFYKIEFMVGTILVVILIDMIFFCNLGLCPE